MRRLALPAVLLIAFGFASLGMGITSYQIRKSVV